MSDEQIQELMMEAGWFQNNRGWWHPPSCLASWPFKEAKIMFEKDRTLTRHNSETD